MFAAKTWLGHLQTRCNDGKSGVGAARTCVNKMPSGSLRTSLENKLESFGGALEPSFSTATSGEEREVGSVQSIDVEVSRLAIV